MAIQPAQAHYMLIQIMPLRMLLLLVLCVIGGETISSQTIPTASDTTMQDSLNTEKITVEIWSDVVCPFCYIGKRHFEKALESFDAKNQVEIIWKSFQLNPELTTDTSITIYESLSQSKGWSLQQSKGAAAQVTDMAQKAGLHYHFDKITVANTFRAHRLIQFAKTLGKGDQLEEKLFQAYFTEGKNIDDPAILADLAAACGIPQKESIDVLMSTQFESEVREDIREASQIGVRGVPFFVFDRKYAVSGAQPVEVFLETLQTIQKEKPVEPQTSSDVKNGASCAPEGKCD